MRIVIVSDPERKDFYNYIVDNLGGSNDIYILWHYKKNINDEPELSLKQLFWKDYRTPEEFIKKVRPDRILFFEIIDLWQIPLIVASHHFTVTTFFIEHGVGTNVEAVKQRFYENPAWNKKLIHYSKKILGGFGKVLRNRIYFFSSTQYLPKDSRNKYFKLLVYSKIYTPIEALSKLKFRERTPHFAILFNRNNVEPFLLYNKIEKENIFSEGVPFFDKYFQASLSEGSHVFFIEHPYLEEKILDWTSEFHESIARNLEKFAIQNGLRLIIKLHPRSNITNWLRYNLNANHIALRQEEDVTEEMLSARLILGYSSTLMNVLIQCKKNTVLLGWHPKPGIFGEDISRTGLCHVSFDQKDLFEKYKSWESENLVRSNPVAYNKFIQEYNYPFDGKATARVINAIMMNEAS